MCCIFTTLVLLGPRVAGVFWWLLQPARWELAFSGFIWPFLGLLFLPWATLMYVIVAPGGVTGFDWVWVVLAVLSDLVSYSGGAYGNRNRIPGYTA